MTAPSAEPHGAGPLAGIRVAYRQPRPTRRPRHPRPRMTESGGTPHHVPMKPFHTEAIPTPRLSLLPLRVQHAAEMASVLSDPALHTFTGGVPASPEDLRTRYERLTAGSPHPAITWHNWVIQLRTEPRLVGTVQATVTGPVAEIAWVVGTPWQGQGIAKESAHALVAWLTGHAVKTVIAHINPTHHASAAVARSAGLRPTDEWQDGEVRWTTAPGTDAARHRPGE